MNTTNLEQQEHLAEASAQTTQPNTQNLHAASIPHTHLYHYQKHQQNSTTLQSHHPFISPFKMDADFWQQARGAPFGLHSSLATNNMEHQSQAPHMQHHQQQLHHHHPPHHLTEQTPQTQVHIPQSSSALTQDDTSAMTEHQQHQHHHHQPQHHTHHQQQLHHHNLNEQEQQHQHSHLTHLENEQSHHLLFNAAAAAAAAAHLSGVVKSNELSNTTAIDDKLVNINNNNNNNNNNSNNNNNHNNSDHNKQNPVAKQEPHATNGSSNGFSVYIGTQAINSNNHTHTPQVISEQHQQQSHLQHPSSQHHKQHLLKFEAEAASSGSLPLEALQHHIQQQMQQQQQQKHGKPQRTLNSNENQKTDNQQQQHHHQHHSQHIILPQQQQPPPANSIDNNSSQNDQQQVSTTTPLAPTSPLRINHQTPTSSPQPSLTSPSAGSSTPDLKFTSDNSKLPNELQLQLSRSNSAAAISERTLEECWSTLQRLFMHKSAMQQMQQQIPRTGLGATGAGGIGAECKPHQCQQCMKSFSSNHQLVQHIRVHTGEKPYKCSYCDRRFKQLSHVQQHTRLHTGERPYKCHLPECGRAFIQLSNLQQHLRNHDAQVERAKNRPFHCNICGKGFATESSLRTHTSKELQLHLGVLQQHAALIGGPNATSCPICHKLFLGTDALMEHVKHVHKEKSSQSNNNSFVESICGSAGNNLSNAGSSSCVQSSGASSSNDPYSAKRRTANHPCPVCGKHYVNEGSLRKHLACHAETSQLTNSLRMWPCSVCQAVFTYENGLLTHMEHMRMDPKHQFAAQYVLSRAAAERRDRDNILATTLVTSSGSSAGGLIPLLGEGSGAGGGGSNSLCPSPSANSECSSNGRLSSSAASDPGSGINLLNNNNNNNNANNNNNHVNNNCNSTSSNISLSNKLNDILRTGSNTNHPLCAPQHPNSHNHNSHPNHPHALSGHAYGGMPCVDADLQNRMSLMAAASAAAAAVAASANNTSIASLPSPQRFGIESTSAATGNAAVQAAVVNLAAAMRLNHTTGTSSATAGTASNDGTLETNLQQTHIVGQSQTNGSQNHTNGRNISPVHNQGLQSDTSTAVINVMRDNMMRSSMMESSSQEASHHQQQTLQQQQQSSGHSTYAHASNTNMSQPTGHHHSQQQQQQQQQQQPTQHLQHLHQQQNSTASGGVLHHLHQQHNHTASELQTTIPPPPPSHSPETNLHMQQQAEAMLRSHTEAAFRLAASVVQQQTNELGNNNNNNNNDKNEQTQQQQQAKPPLTNDNSQQKIHLNQNTGQDISEVLRLQEHRLEQALRLHSDARTYNFLNTSANQPQQHQQQQTQPNNPINHTNANTSNTTQPQQQQHHHTT